MSSRSQQRKSGRNYDRESGINRVSGKSKKKQQLILSESEPDSASSEDEVATARKKIVKKPFKADSRRRIVAEATDDEDEEEERPKRKDKTSTAVVSTSRSPDGQAPELAVPFSALFVALDVFGISSPVHHEPSRYGVSFFGMFTLLHGIELAIGNNTRINNYISEYFSLAARIWYAYMGIYHLLRAKIAAGVSLPAIQRRVYRRLENEFPLESCPIAAPLIPWFMSVGAFKPSDGMYNWLRPLIPAFTQGSTFWADQGNDKYFFPPIPQMVAFMRTLANINGNAHNRHLSNGGYIIPVENDGAGTAVAWHNHNWETDGTTAQHASIHTAFSRPGLSWSLPESNAYMSAPRRLAWKRMNLPNPAHTTVVDDLEKYLFMDGNSSLEWLKRIRHHAIAQAKFFKGSVNLSQISPTTNADPTVIIDLDAPNAAPAQIQTYEHENNSYVSCPAAGNSMSGQINDIEFQRAMISKPIIHIQTVNNLFPAIMNGGTQTIDGPWYRYQAANGTYTGNLRNRWRRSNDSHHNIDDELKTRIRLDMYNAMGTDPEPVTIV